MCVFLCINEQFEEIKLIKMLSLMVRISLFERSNHYIKNHCCIFFSVTACYNYIHLNFTKMQIIIVAAGRWNSNLMELYTVQKHTSSSFRIEKPLLPPWLYWIFSLIFYWIEINGFKLFSSMFCIILIS